MKPMHNKSIIITGGAGGIGLATAQMFLNEGGKDVLLVDKNQKALDEAKRELNNSAVHCFVADISVPAEVKAYTDKAMELFGKLDVVFLNAGYEGVVKPLSEYPEDIFDKVMDINVKGVWLGLKYAFPYMQKSGGSIIITCSVAGLTGTANMVAYTTSKHAIIGTMRVAALEGAPYKIRVNTVHPGPVDNRMMRSLEEGFAPGAGAEVKKGFESQIPLGRYATNEDIASMVTFLASDKSKYITGAMHVVDGGFNI
ncbi:SDR family NAD(P)-dependent oxidoreductase [Cognataquiflexum rubidum]|uniref:SDR family NAD(P)-dependent oxidoreductase n=1 Tax=Cognataquiflexum rubidum TaxID=2922273 RepID=UPI001F12E9D3|nr:SDR family oxidoreductase [Cognataquiflexum rubidum]MCH6233014.1 SDR family oxidoreductase [Cognataquiflexum rubidum]